jgi:uncharacterized protein involved in type VI secretion and phage assembly
MLLQLNESNLTFLQRILAERGVFYWSECIDDREVIVFSDNNLNCPYIERDAISLKQQAGLSPSWFYGAFSRSVKHQRVASRAGVQRQCQPPKPYSTSNAANCQYYELGHRSNTEIEQTSDWLQQSLDAQSSVLTLTANVEQMAAGHCFSFIDQPLSQDHSGDYLAISVEHKFNDTANHSDAGYVCKVTAIRREKPFRSPVPQRPQLPFALSAKIESSSQYAHVDEAGNYTIRWDFDQSESSPTEASQPLRKLTPYACAGQEQATGFHFPLLDGDRILVSCLNNNPQEAYIIGFVQQDDQPPVVTAENLWQNRLKTAAGNELVFDDNEQNPRIVLQSLNSEHRLELNGTESAPYIELLCQFGALTVSSGSDQTITVGDSLTEQVGGARTLVVNQNHRTETKGKLQRQSAATLSMTAENLIQFKADDNFTLKLAKGINGRSENTQILTASENFQITASGGSVFLQASDDIRIEGDGSGDIIIENGGGGIKMDADGNVTLFGNVISFNKDNVTFNGNVSYDIESPPSPPSVEVEAPKELVEVDEFELENFQAPVRSNTIITHRDKLTGEPLAGAPYLVITPEKDIIRGTLDENGQARINHPSPEQCKVILLSENTERLEQ